MGWFSKKRLITASQILPLVEDTPDIVKQSITHSVLNNGDMVPEMLDSINNCLASRVNKYHRYAKTKYTNGLPEGSVGYERVPAEQIQAALDGDYPAPTGKHNVILSAALDELDTDRYAWEMLGTDTDFDPDTNQWTLENTGEVGTLVTYVGASIESDNTLIVNGSYNAYVGGEQESVIVQRRYTTPYKLVPDDLYYLAQYVVIDDVTGKQSKGKYWNYWINSNKYPDMLPTYSKFESLYMPVVPIRINNVSYTSEDRWDTPLYKTSKHLLKIIDIKIEQLDEGVNNNPDIKDVDHAYFVLGVNPAQDNESVNKYLFLFFNDLAAKSEVSKGEFNKWFHNPEKFYQPPINTLSVKDDTYNTALAWNYIDTQLIEGSIGKVDTVTKVIDAKYGQMGISFGDPARPTYITIENPANILVLRKQVSETHYQQLTVSGLMFSNRIYGPDKDYITTLAADKDGDEILLPLNLSIINDMPKLDANTLFYYSMQMVFNAYEWKKLKWYQTGFFKFVTMIVAIAITIVSSGGLSGITSALIGIASAGVAGIAIAIGQYVVASILIQTAFKFAAEHLGIEFAMIFAAAMMVYGISGSDALYGLPFADDLLKIASIGLDAVTEVVGEELMNIQQGMTELAQEAKDAFKQLEDITNELSPQVTLDPIGLYTEVGMLPNESADMFLTRSMQANPGLLVLDTVNTFVDNSLRLDYF